MRFLIDHAVKYNGIMYFAGDIVEVADGDEGPFIEMGATAVKENVKQSADKEKRNGRRTSRKAENQD